jgi:hypothetical protein
MIGARHQDSAGSAVKRRLAERRSLLEERVGLGARGSSLNRAEFIEGLGL